MEEAFKTFKVHESPFKMIYVNLTSRCNMKCNFCYMEGRDEDDISIDYFEEVCKTLPHRVVFRLAGGEPTIHPKFFEILDICKKYRHLPTIVSNGRKFLDEDFIRQAKEFDGNGVWCITLNGGWTNPEAYKFIDNEDCLEWKTKAIQNLIDANIRRVALSSIIVRGLNEHVIGEFIKYAQKYRRQIRYLKFRSSGNLGRYIRTEPYDVVGIIPSYFVKYFDESKCKTVYTTRDPSLIEICKTRECCHHFTYDKFLLVSFVDFATYDAQRCWKRGKVDNNMNVTSFFKEMVDNARDKEIQI